jgi:hypothetical protein
MADAAHFIFTRKSRRCTGNFFVDDEVLVSEVGERRANARTGVQAAPPKLFLIPHPTHLQGVRDFSKYNVTENIPQHELFPDFFV